MYMYVGLYMDGVNTSIGFGVSKCINERFVSEVIGRTGGNGARNATVEDITVEAVRNAAVRLPLRSLLARHDLYFPQLGANAGENLEFIVAAGHDDDHVLHEPEHRRLETVLGHHSAKLPIQCDARRRCQCVARLC